MEVALVAVSAAMLGSLGVLVWNFIDRRGEAQLYREKLREVGQRERERDDAFAARDQANAKTTVAEKKAADVEANAAALRVELDAANAKVREYEAKALHDSPVDRFGDDLDSVLSGKAADHRPADTTGSDRGQSGPATGVRPGSAGSAGEAIDGGGGTTSGPRRSDR